MLTTLYPKTYSQVQDHIKKGIPSLYVSSKTSTVIAYDFLNSLDLAEKCLVDLSSLPSKIELLENNIVKVEGAVSWEDLKVYLRSHGKDLMTSPTDQSANVLAGLATACTGELAFGYGTLRSQTHKIEYIDNYGKVQELFKKELNIPQSYQDEQRKYQGFKNAPFPILNNEIDLLIGTEGQLGVITACEIQCVDAHEDTFLLIPLKRWEENFSQHLEIFSIVQAHRGKILSCELLDSNSLGFAKDNTIKNSDIMVLQVLNDELEYIYDEVISKLNLDLESIFEMKEASFSKLRTSIPRQVNEYNSRHGIIKKGTDVQVKAEEFEKLLELYQEFSKTGVKYNLFGHFGDAHLHFNFLPNTSQVGLVDELLEQFYEDVIKLGGSPFAEHGIGLIKQKFAKSFWNEHILNYFKELKLRHDKDGIFFPSGYLSFPQK